VRIDADTREVPRLPFRTAPPRRGEAPLQVFPAVGAELMALFAKTITAFADEPAKK